MPNAGEPRSTFGICITEAGRNDWLRSVSDSSRPSALSLSSHSQPKPDLMDASASSSSSIHDSTIFSSLFISSPHHVSRLSPRSRSTVGRPPRALPMNFKNFNLNNPFGINKRKNNHHHLPIAAAPSPIPSSDTVPPAQVAQPSSSSSTPAPQLPTSNSSSASLPMNNPSNQLGRPPSYTHPANVRPASPIPPGHPYGTHQTLAQYPPPINTGVGGPPIGYATAPPPMVGPPPVQPPMYGYPLPQPPLPYAHHRMNDLPLQQRSKPQLIVGIDFGTTFSGVAFAFATNTEAREDIITEWPGSGTNTKQKVSFPT